jgi:hypothetical protein
VVQKGKIARFRSVFYVFESPKREARSAKREARSAKREARSAKREARSAGHVLLTKRAARAQRGSRVHHPQGCIICAWFHHPPLYIYIYIYIYGKKKFVPTKGGLFTLCFNFVRLVHHFSVTPQHF